jgi:hypothetical protein
MLVAMALAYLLIGLLAVFVGPAARSIRHEGRMMRRVQSVPGWKIAVFQAVLALGTILLWPILVPSAARSSSIHSKSLSQDRARGLEELVKMMSALNPDAVDADELPDARGAFGLSENNPIPTRSIVESRHFLERLRTSDGTKVLYERIGSFSSEATNHPVDGYRITRPDGSSLATLYFSPYQKRTSAKVPHGFGLIDSRTGQISFAADTRTALKQCGFATKDFPDASEPSPDGDDSLVISPKTKASEELPASHREDASPRNAPSPGIGTSQDGSKEAGTVKPREANPFPHDIADLRAAAQNGDPESQYALGLRFIYGHGVERSSVLGERWLSQAGQSGHVEAQFSLGVLHWDGLLLDHGVQQARLWLELAAKQGHTKALNMLPIVQARCQSRPTEVSKAAPQEKFTQSDPAEASDAAPQEKAERSNITKMRVRSIRRAAQDGLPPVGGRRPRTAHFEFSVDAAITDSENHRLFRRGVAKGKRCLKAAEQALMQRLVSTSDLTASDERVRMVARAIASRRGYTLVGEAIGMEDLIDGSDPLFDERRAAFISGVFAGIDGTEDE